MTGIMLEEPKEGSEMTKIWVNDITNKPAILDIQSLKNLRDNLNRILEKHNAL